MLTPAPDAPNNNRWPGVLLEKETDPKQRARAQDAVEPAPPGHSHRPRGGDAAGGAGGA